MEVLLSGACELGREARLALQVSRVIVPRRVEYNMITINAAMSAFEYKSETRRRRPCSFAR